MKLSILLLIAVCWVNAAPKHKSHRNLPKIGANSNKHGLYSIVGSKTCSIKKYPYTAAVLTTSNMLLGGASIYNKKWILTAGWNTYGESVSNLEVRVGSDNALKGGQLIKLSKMIPHPNYTAADWDWDVALLKLKKNIKFSKKAKAIKVSDTLPKNKSTGVITGWGSRNYLSQNLDSDKLQELTIDIYDRNTCIKKWWDNESVNPRSYCAFKPGCGPCSSDFGDPLVQNGKVVGMYLGGYGCAIDYYPGVFSALAKFYDWIAATVKKYSDPADLDDSDVQYYGEDDDDEEDDEAEEEEWEDEEAEEEEEEEGANDDDLRNKEDNDAKIVGAGAIGVA